MRHPTGELTVRTAMVVAVILIVMAGIIFAFDYFFLQSRMGDDKDIGITDVLVNAHANDNADTDAVVTDPEIPEGWSTWTHPTYRYDISLPDTYAITSQDNPLSIYRIDQQLDPAVQITVYGNDVDPEDLMEKVKSDSVSKTVKETTLNRSFSDGTRLEVVDAVDGTVVYHYFIYGGYIYELREVGSLEQIIGTFRLP